MFSQLRHRNQNPESKWQRGTAEIAGTFLKSVLGFKLVCVCSPNVAKYRKGVLYMEEGV